MDRYDLYERCVQSPDDVVRLLVAIHGCGPNLLGEDFSGTGAVSRSWVRLVRRGHAVAVDADPEPLQRAAGIARLTVRNSDVLAADDPADVIFVGNFSIGEIKTRSQLVHYLRHAHRRLRRGGVFVCDTYGGESAFLTGHVERTHPGPEGTTIRYTWEQRDADPLTGRVIDAMHFRVERGDEIIAQVRDAFVYDWRLWSVPELRDALRDAGFVRTDVYAHLPDAVDEAGAAHVRPIGDPSELDDCFIVCVAGRND